MRSFNTITSWLMWIVAVLLWLMFLSIRLVDTVPSVAAGPGQPVANTSAFSTIVAMMSALAAIAYTALRFFWHRPGRPPGFGSWLLSVFLYLCVIGIPSNGFVPYFAAGDRSALPWVSLAVGALFLVLSFPRLPSAHPPSFTAPPI